MSKDRWTAQATVYLDHAVHAMTSTSVSLEEAWQHSSVY